MKSCSEEQQTGVDVEWVVLTTLTVMKARVSVKSQLSPLAGNGRCKVSLQYDAIRWLYDTEKQCENGRLMRCKV